ncbi:hypothetical protein ACFWPP_02915 [Streptomyces anulatus]
MVPVLNRSARTLPNVDIEGACPPEPLTGQTIEASSNVIDA